LYLTFAHDYFVCLFVCLPVRCLLTADCQ